MNSEHNTAVRSVSVREDDDDETRIPRKCIVHPFVSEIQSLASLHFLLLPASRGGIRQSRRDPTANFKREKLLQRFSAKTRRVTDGPRGYSPQASVAHA